MKAVIYKKYGPPEVLQLAELPKPVPKNNQVLVRNHATAVNSGDWRLRKPDPFAVRFAFGLFSPRKSKQVLGSVYAGIVEAVGSEVTTVKPGDRVLGMSGMAMGAYAEYICVPEKSALVVLPSNIGFTEAAAIPFGATTAIHFLEKAKISQGQSVLIYGASGAVGTAAVQLAKYYGAKVTAVCSSANREMVMQLGADECIDYTTHNFSRHNVQYDVVYETVNKLPYRQCVRLVKPKGVLLLGSAGAADMLRGLFARMGGKIKVVFGMAMETPASMKLVQQLVESGQLKPVIDKMYRLNEVPEAHRYVEAGHKKGNVVVQII